MSKRRITLLPILFRKDHFDLGNDLSTMKMTLGQQNNTINGFFRQNHMKKRYYTCS